MKICRNGITRAVLLIGPYALKFPRWRYGWNKFLRGLLSNMCETNFMKMTGTYRMAPTLWGVPGGFMNVQRRCEPLTDEEWSDLEEMADYSGLGEWHGFRADFKRDNFGTIGGQIVLLDYGELT